MSQRILSLIVQDRGVDAALFETNIRECRYVRSEFFEFPEPVDVVAEPEESEQDDVSAEDEPAVSPLVQTLVSLRESFSERYETIAVGLGSGYYTCRNLELPTSDPRQLEGMVGFQLDDISPFDIEDLALSWSRRGEGNASLVTAATMDREALVELLDALTVQGLEPRILAPAASALMAGPLEEEGPLLRLHVHRGQLHAVVADGNDLLWCRSTHLGDDLDNDTLIRSLSPALAGLAPELRPTRFAVVGDLGFEHDLSTSLGLEEVSWSSVSASNAEAIRDKQSVDLNLPFLMGWAISEEPQCPMNFRFGEFAYEGDFALFRRPLTHFATGLSIVLMLMMVSLITRSVLSSNFEAKLKQRFCDETEEVVGRPICEPTMALNVMRMPPDLGGVSIPSYSAGFLLEALGKILPSDLDVKFTEMDIRLGQTADEADRVQVQGDAGSFQDINALKDVLNTDACVSKVKEGNSKMRNDRKEFNLEVEFRCPPGVKPGTQKVGG